ASELVEGVEVELESEQLPYGRLDRVVERLDAHTAVRGLDPNLSARDHAVEAPVLPDVGAIDAPECEAVERPLEVVRLRHCDDGHDAEASEASEVCGRPGLSAEPRRERIEHGDEASLGGRRAGIRARSELEARVLGRRTACSGL